METEINQKRYVVVGSRPWNEEIFYNRVVNFPGKWFYVDDPSLLEVSLDTYKPWYVFFVHWSEKGPDEIIKKYECICFHPTHLPAGRGGSPIQNMILEGKTSTRITAFRMTSELDAGPVYATSKKFDLVGSAQEIFNREMWIVSNMIYDIVKNEPLPFPQVGIPTYYKRRKPQQSKIDGTVSTDELYNLIRALDADTYPRAFLEYGEYRLEFSEAEMVDKKELIAKVRFSKDGS